MAVLINCPHDTAEEFASWGGLLRRLEPGLEVRVWPDTGPVEEIEYALVWKPETGDLTRYPNLKFIFNLGAGVDSLLADRTLPRQVPILRVVDEGLTTGMTEYVLLHVLRYHRRMPEFEDQQRRSLWRPLLYPLARHRRVGIMGQGVLGGDAAARLVGLGFDVAGWSRSPKALPGVTGFHGPDGLLPFLARSEILVCLLPLTPETAGIVNARTLAALPQGASVINAARGGHVVADDLLAALDSGHIAHATLDVFTPEPLAPEHPFWRHPRVTLTPHVASLTQPETTCAVVIEQIRRARAGLPLENVVSLERGY